MRKFLLSLMMLVAVTVTTTEAQTQLKISNGATNLSLAQQLNDLSRYKAAQTKVKRTVKAASENADDNATEEDGSKVVLTPPDGEARYYYLDQMALDPYALFKDYPFLYDYHRTVKLVFCDNGDVWMPCVLNRNNIKGYIKGKYNDDHTKLIFKNGQPVYWAPNEKVYYVLALGDKTGGGAPSTSDADDTTLAQDSETDATTNLYASVITFDVDATTGVISFEVDPSKKWPFISIVNANNPAESVYAISANMKLVPAANVDNNLQNYSYAYHNQRSDEDATSTVKVWVDGTNYFFKGLNPKYPEMWVYGTLTKDGNSILIPSLQVSKYDMFDFPYYLMAVKKQADNNDPDDSSAFDAYFSFILSLDKTTGNITGLPEADGFMMANGYVNEQVNGMDYFQRYNNISLTPSTLTLAKPATPTFYGFRYSYGENNFVFTVTDKDVDGNTLSTDNLTYVIYVDGQPFTFKKSECSHLKTEEMTEVPYLYDDYYHIATASSGDRYIYIKGDEMKGNIGVELHYTVNGQTAVSDRLVYDCSSKTYNVVPTGINNIKGSVKTVSTQYFDLTGRHVDAAYKGVVICVSHMADGTVKTTKMVK